MLRLFSRDYEFCIIEEVEENHVQEGQACCKYEKCLKAYARVNHEEAGVGGCAVREEHYCVDVTSVFEAEDPSCCSWIAGEMATFTR